jgi:hypothetical protein
LRPRRKKGKTGSKGELVRHRGGGMGQGKKDRWAAEKKREKEEKGENEIK